MHVKNGLALVDVRHVDVDLAIKATRPHQSFVQNVGPVRRREDDHPAVRPKSVHLGQELVQGVFALVVRAEIRVLAARPADGVNLVDENDGGRFLLGLLEQVAHAGCPHADEHLDKIGTAQAEEWHLRLSCYSFGEQGFSRTRRPYKQCAFGDFRSELGVLAGMLQEIHDFLKFLLGTIDTCDVVEGHVRAFSLFEDLRFGFADVEDLASTWSSSAKATHQEHPHNHHQAKEDDPLQDLTTPFVGRFIAQFEAMFFLQVLQIGLVIISDRNVHRCVGSRVQRLE